MLKDKPVSPILHKRQCSKTCQKEVNAGHEIKRPEQCTTACCKQEPADKEPRAIDAASEFPRSQSDQAPMEPAGQSLIH